jgi:hypothetical protein
MEILSQLLISFIDTQNWTYAKTYPKWPHEYIVRENVDEKLFVELVTFIRKNGYIGRFYKMETTYFDFNEYTYWTMGEPLEVTTIINRCLKENTYENRLKNGTLPEDKINKEPSGLQII